MADITTALQICNLGLSYLKVPTVDSITSLVAPQKEVKTICAQWYDLSRQEALRAHPWNFARGTAKLAVSATAPLFGYDSKFPLPTDFLRLRFIGEDNYGLVGIDFDFESSDYILTSREVTEHNAITITGITAADPAVVTAAAHGLSNGDTILIEDVVGMTEVNDTRFLVADKTTDTFELTTEAGVDVDASAYTAYASGGTATQVDTLNIGYIKDVEDVTYFDPLFVTYLSLVFAKNICYGVTGKTTLRRDIREMLLEASIQARAINGQDNPPRRVTRSRVLGARRRYSGGSSEVTDPKYISFN
uniref:Putative tail tubular protein n=1 Tax=viral metagenome TaxID=1070528 RepID=A0A6M3MCC1_9ZZZZ